MLQQLASRASVAVGSAGAVAAVASLWARPAAQAGTQAPAGLKPDEWTPVKLEKKYDVNYNTVHLRFGLASPEHTTNLNVASCLVVRAPIGEKKDDGSNEMVIRPYTPVSKPDSKGHFDLMVKVYEKGNISKYLGEMKEGESIEAKGPIQKLPYKANMKKKIGMLAGGSGITPMYQVVQEVLSNPDDKTDVSLIFANTSPKDILLKDEFDKMAKEHSNFHVFYTVDNPPSMGWKGGKGHIDKEKVSQHAPAPSDDNLILVCGPPPMMKALSGDKAKDKSQGELTGLLKDMGYTEDMVYKF